MDKPRVKDNTKFQKEIAILIEKTNSMNVQHKKHEHLGLADNNYVTYGRDHPSE